MQAKTLSPTTVQKLIKASAAEGNDQFDLILANIIKGMILNNLGALAKQLLPNGTVILSGLLLGDENEYCI